MAHPPIDGRREFPGTIEDAIASMVRGAILVVCDGCWTEEAEDLVPCNCEDANEDAEVGCPRHGNLGLAFEHFLEEMIGGETPFQVSVFHDNVDKKDRQTQWLADVKFNAGVGVGHYRGTEEDGCEKIQFISVDGKKVGVSANTQSVAIGPSGFYLTPSALKALMKKFLRSVEYFQFLFDTNPSKKIASDLVKLKLAGEAPPAKQVVERMIKEDHEPAFPHIPGKLFGKSDNDIIIAMAWEEAAAIFGTDFLISDQKTYLKYQLRMLNDASGIEQRIEALAKQHHFGQRDWCLVFTQDRNDKFFVQRLQQCRSKRVADL